MRKKYIAIKDELLSYTAKEKVFVLLAILCSFCITCEYAITKPTSNSIFISHYSVALYPYAWLLTVPLNFFVVSLYNRFLTRLGCFRMFLCSISITIGLNLLSALYMQHMPGLPFLLYVWKDIYVLLMFQQLWSFIHSLMKMKRAKYLYGILFGFGGVGSICGSMIPSFLAIKWGSENLLFLTAPIYFLFAIFFYFLLQTSRDLEKEIGEREEKPSISEGFKLIHRSFSLKFILLIVIFMQFATTIMDYQFNIFLEKAYPHQDVRTEFCGKLWGMINTYKLCLQFFATFLLVQVIGLKKSHFIVPTVLIFNAIGCIILPTFSFITYAFSVIKILDYSIFNIIKEMLYLPLKREEKFKAKAIIDIFAYRSSKALASFFVMGIQLFYPAHLPYAFSWGPLILFLLWIFTVYFFTLKKGKDQTKVIQFS